MKNQLRIGAILSYVNIAISIIIGFVVSPLLINGLGDSEYGAYKITAALISYMSILDFGLYNSVTRYVSRYQARKQQKEQESFIAISLILFSVIALIVLIVAAIIYKNLDNIYGGSSTAEEIEIIRKLMVILSVNLAITMPGSVFHAVIVAHERFVVSRICLIVKQIMRLVLIIFIVKLSPKAVSVATIDFILNMMVIVAGIIYCFAYLKIKVKLHSFSTEYLKGILSFSLFIFIAAVADQINWNTDTTVLGIILGTASVTLYNVSGNLLGYYRNLSGALSGIFLPKATKMVACDCSDSELTDLMIKIGRIQMMILGAVLVVFSVVGKDFISLWVGERFLDCYKWFLIMAIPLIVPLTQCIGVNILEAKNMHRFRAILYFLTSVFNIVLTVVLVNRYGIIGSAVGTAISMLIGNNVIINWYYAFKVKLEMGRFYKEVYLKLIPLQIIIFAVCYGADSFITTNVSWTAFILKALAVAAVYCLAIYFIGFNSQEKHQVTQIIKDVLRKKQN